jgi:chromosome segregation ATPase
VYALKEKLSKMKDVHRDLSTKISEKNKGLAHLNEELEQTRRQLDDRGSIMADGGTFNCMNSFSISYLSE